MSDDDKWDSENFRTDLHTKSGPIGLISNQWDGEDEEEDVKDCWDDPEEEEQEESKETENEEPTVKAIQVKRTKKLLSKIEEKERKYQEDLLEKKLQQEKESMTPEELQAEKLRQQKLQEEADLEVAKHLLGVNISSDLPVLESKEDFEKYKDEIVKQLGSATKNQNFPDFVETLVQALCVHLSAAELKKIHTKVGNLQIEKHKMEQGTKSKKKGKGGKAKLKLDDDTDIYSSYNEDVYDDFM